MGQGLPGGGREWAAYVLLIEDSLPCYSRDLTSNGTCYAPKSQSEPARCACGMDVPAFSETNMAALMASLAALRRTLPGSDSPRPCARPCSS